MGENGVNRTRVLRPMPPIDDGIGPSSVPTVSPAQRRFEKVQGYIYLVHVAIVAVCGWAYWQGIVTSEFTVLVGLTVGIAVLIQVTLTMVARLISRRVVRAIDEVRTTVTDTVVTRIVNAVNENAQTAYARVPTAEEIASHFAVDVDAIVGAVVAEMTNPERPFAGFMKAEIGAILNGRAGVEMRKFAAMKKEMAKAAEDDAALELAEDYENGDPEAANIVEVTKGIGKAAARLKGREGYEQYVEMAELIDEAAPFINRARKRRQGLYGHPGRSSPNGSQTTEVWGLSDR